MTTYIRLKLKAKALPATADSFTIGIQVGELTIDNMYKPPN